MTFYKSLLFVAVPIGLFFSATFQTKTEWSQDSASGKANPSIQTQPKADENEVWGIDISHHQENVNWSVLAEKNKPHFVILKSTEGTSVKDRKYSEYYTSARKHEITVGTYHFFSYRSKGNTQASNYMTTAKIQKGDIIPILDVEYRRHMPSRAVIIKEIQSFCKEVYKKYKVKPILYCNHSYYYKYLANDFKDYKFWIADYQNEPRVEWVMWQHTEKAKIQGIPEYVDRNILNPKHKLSDFIVN